MFLTLGRWSAKFVLEGGREGEGVTIMPYSHILEHKSLPGKDLGGFERAPYWRYWRKIHRHP